MGPKINSCDPLGIICHVCDAVLPLEARFQATLNTLAESLVSGPGQARDTEQVLVKFFFFSCCL